MDPRKGDIAKQYGPAEHMTGPFGRLLLEQCGLDHADGSTDIVLLDNATGTGVVLVVAGDIQPSMLKAVQERAEKHGWTGTRTQVVDAMNMDLPSDHFTHVVSSFALVVLPDPRAALAEIRRVLRPAGVAGFTIWKSVGWFDVARAAVERIPGAPPRFPSFQEFSASFAKAAGAVRADHDQWIVPAFFEERIREAGFGDVRTEVRENRTRYEDAEACVRVFAPLMNFALATTWSAEERERVEGQFGKTLLEW
uniref:Methyltransf_11 domain-containing protein n=1 Tax=Ganoderma boninense TaxID=34458 RepID=A0A5K1JU11_9APHY|nr:Methyltransf_11 domain-containing protein [Ganoderma boninense]